MNAKLPSRWLSSKEQKLWRAYLGAQFRLAKLLDEDFDESAGIDHLTYEIFVNLSESKDHSMRMTELAKSVSAQKSKLTYRIDQLEKQGLVKRENCKQDARGQLCTLTKKGYDKLVRTAPHHVQAVLKNFIYPINPKEVSNLTKIFDSIASNVQTLPHLKE